MKGSFVSANCIRTSLLDALSAGWRFDLRKLLESRKTNLRISSRGSCTARLGSTIVSSSVEGEIVEPNSSRPSEGVVHFNLCFFTPVSVSDSATRPQEYVNEIRSLLRDSVLQSGSIDLESLCIISGEKVWKITVNLTVLNADGNVLDCASLAAIGSLAYFSLPATTAEGRCVRIWDAYEKAPVPLVMNHYPIFTTFCLFHDGKTVVIDPSEVEERLSESKLYIAVNARQEVCVLKSVAKKRILPDELHRCIAIAESHVRCLTDVLLEKLEVAKRNRKMSTLLDDHETFHEIFDISFDLPWRQLMSPPTVSEKRSKLKPADGAWGIDMDSLKDDAADSPKEEKVSFKIANDTCAMEDATVVEYSEFDRKSESQPSSLILTNAEHHSASKRVL